MTYNPSPTLTLPKVVLVGRANVGKSSLFNRFIEKQQAITSPIAGTTRDINRGICYWNGVSYEILDTGGIETIVSNTKLKNLAPKANEDYGTDIIKQSQRALKDADLVLFVVDGLVGVQQGDINLAKNLRAYNKPTILIVNKIDRVKNAPQAHEFNKLGMDNMLTVSAFTSLGIGDALDEITKQVKKATHVRSKLYVTPEKGLNIALLGRPNVGKSSLFNKLVGDETSIVSPLEHTTREPHDVTITVDGLTLTFIDTAGIRRKSRVEKGIEEQSVEKTKEALKRADVVLFMIDVSTDITQQDRHLAELIAGSDAGIIMIANKWDLVEGKVVETQNEVRRNIYRNFPFMTWVPIYFVSAKTGQHVPNIITLIKDLQENRSKTVDQEWLNLFIKRATIHHKPMASTGISRPKILDFEQVGTNPPVFQMRIRQKDTISTQYLRYLENQLRDALGIKGTKLWIKVKK